MTMNPIDDGPLDALLNASDEALPDGGFTAAVMDRVRADGAWRLAPTLDAALALALLAQRSASARRSRRWRWIGLTVGSAIALLAMHAAGSALPALTAQQALALLAGISACAWVLMTTHAPHERR
jgi:hypothetical protein